MKKQITIAVFMVGSMYAINYRGRVMNIQTKKAYHANIVDLTLKNDFFRKELITGTHSQVVLMSIPVGEDIGEEVHTVDQTLVFVQGKGELISNGQHTSLDEGSLLFVPAGTKHNVKNSGSQPLKLYTLYAPAQHKPGTVEKVKTEY